MGIKKEHIEWAKSASHWETKRVAKLGEATPEQIIAHGKAGTVKHDYSRFAGSCGYYNGGKYKGTMETYRCVDCGKTKKFENNYYRS